ncbi:hypothetical protein [Actinokineospora iranica]|nr:hypothetical protein [Actinokineospora iranica]
MRHGRERVDHRPQRPVRVRVQRHARAGDLDVPRAKSGRFDLSF